MRAFARAMLACFHARWFAEEGLPRACVGSSGVGTRAELNGNTPQKPPASARLGVHPVRHAPSLPASPKTRESIDASLQEHHTWILELMRWSWCQQSSNSHQTECCRRCRAGGAGSWATAIRCVLPRTDPSVPFVAAADSRPFADFAWCRVCWNSDFSPWSAAREQHPKALEQADQAGH